MLLHLETPDRQEFLRAYAHLPARLRQTASLSELWHHLLTQVLRQTPTDQFLQKLYHIAHLDFVSLRTLRRRILRDYLLREWMHIMARGEGVLWKACIMLPIQLCNLSYNPSPLLAAAARVSESDWKLYHKELLSEGLVQGPDFRPVALPRGGKTQPTFADPTINSFLKSFFQRRSFPCTPASKKGALSCSSPAASVTSSLESQHFV